MSGKKERKIKMTSFRFDINNDDDRKALEFLKAFKHKQSDFLVSLLLWYSEHAEKYGLTFLPEEKRIIDLSKANTFLESFGFSKEESQKLIEKYNYDQLTNIKIFLKDIESIRGSSEPEIAYKAKCALKEDVSNKENNIEENPFKNQSELKEPVEIKESEILERTLKEKTETKILESEDDDGEDDWLLGMAGTPSQS